MLYPFKFEPILKHRIWGGAKLETVLHKKKTDDKAIGESWELSGVVGEESVVVNGDLAGNTINDLLEVYMDELVGGKVFEKYGFMFPLLFKFIDANEKLSIQVHPTDEMVEEEGLFGKTEMWYVIDAEEGAELVVGFNQPMSKEDYQKHLADNTLDTVLKKVKVSAGDVFYIPAGLVHSIGKGILLAEVQQTSDVTYRIYDYNRLDEDGNPRQLHVKEALETIDFENQLDSKIQYKKIINHSTPLVSCECFITNLLSFDKSIIRDYSEIESFVVLMCLEGSCVISWEVGREDMSKGDTILVPSEICRLDLESKGLVEILEVRVQ